jgi:hypothetical protein
LSDGFFHLLVSSGVGVLFLVWIAATILFQFDAPSLFLSRFDVFRILPRWTFFSPNPGQHDMHLVYRDRRLSGLLTAWREVDFIATPAAIPLLWNPEKRLAKILWDCWASIQHFNKLNGYNPVFLPVSGAYVMLLNVALRGPRIDDGYERQFALLRSKGFVSREIQPLFVSQFHLLPVIHSIASESNDVMVS